MKFKYFFAALGALVIFSSCEKDDEPQSQEPTVQKAPVVLHYDFKYGSDDFNLDQNYTTDNGEIIKFTLATYYLSKPAIMDDADNRTMLDPEYYIVRPDVMMSAMGSIDPGHAHMFNISIGVDEATNTEDGASGVQPTDFSDANHPLAPQPEGMYWSWASGYIFVKIEGEVDYDADGTFDNTFKYHLGTNEFRKDRSLMIHQEVAAGDTLALSMKVDYKEFLKGIDLETEFLTMSMGDARPLGIKMMNQFDAATSFSVGGGHDHN